MPENVYLTEERLREIIAEELAKVAINSTEELSGSVFDPANVNASAIRQLQLMADTMNAMAVSRYERDYADAQRNWDHGQRSVIAAPAAAWVVSIDNSYPMSYKLAEGEGAVTEERLPPWEVETVAPPPTPEGYISIGAPINNMGRMYGFFDNGSNVPMGTQTAHQGIELWFKAGGAVAAAVWLPV